MQQGVRAKRSLLELLDVLDGVGDADALLVGDLVGDELGETIALVQGELLHTSHVLDGALGGHRAIGDDVCHALIAIFIRDPAQDVGATIVVEVHIDIGHGDTVGVEEALEEQVVAYRVNIRDA